MVHKISWPYNRRVFPVLVVTAMVHETAFIIVQIPIASDDLAHLSTSEHCRAKKAVVGTYCSVEYCYLGGVDTTQWVMATCSDAGGNIPTKIQHAAIPGAIAGDVPKFINWISGEREPRRVSDTSEEEHVENVPQGKLAATSRRVMTLRRDWTVRGMFSLKRGWSEDGRRGHASFA